MGRPPQLLRASSPLLFRFQFLVASKKRISGLLLVFVIANGHTVTCATRGLLPGDADRGRDVFRTENCSVCHSINGKGGKRAPDLGQGVERDFSPYVLAGRLW